jgi:hypothetical protein
MATLKSQKKNSWRNASRRADGTRLKTSKPWWMRPSAQPVFPARWKRASERSNGRVSQQTLCLPKTLGQHDVALRVIGLCIEKPSPIRRN